MGRILLVDDEQDARRVLAASLRLDQHLIWEVSGVAAAQRILAADTFDVVITGSNMADGEGAAVLKAARKGDSTVSVILLADSSGTELAAVSLASGIVEFLNKPLQPDVVRAAVQRACERTRLLRENNFLKEHVARLQSLAYVRVPNLEADAVQLSAAPPLTTAEIGGEIDQPASQFPAPALPHFFDLTALLEKTEKEAILRTLSASGGVQAEAARRMGLSRSALSYKLNKYGILSRKKQSASAKVSHSDKGSGQNVGNGCCEI